MAITITKAPADIYPAYNDGWVQFTSTLPSNEFAEIEILPASIFPTKFLVYPDSLGVYSFNLREAVRILLNQDGFSDQNAVAPVDWGESYPYGYLIMDSGGTNQIQIDVYDNVSTPDTPQLPTYEFIRGVKQLGESVYVNPAQLLNVSDNGIDYKLTYFEGYPFTLELQRITNGDAIYINNLNSGDNSVDGSLITSGAFTITTWYRIVSAGTTDFTLIGAADSVVGTIFQSTGVGLGTGTATEFTPLYQTATGSYRLWVDKGTSNWTTSGFLPLSDTINRLEIYSGTGVAADTFRTNLRIKKVTERNGVYLKWFNSDGGYSYWLFDKFTKETFKGRSVGEVANNQFLNVGDTRLAPTTTLGKDVSKAVLLKTKVDEDEAVLLESLFLSPLVQMYTSNTPYISGEWVDVSISSSYSISNKKALNDVSLSVILPDLITAKL